MGQLLPHRRLFQCAAETWLEQQLRIPRRAQWQLHCSRVSKHCSGCLDRLKCRAFHGLHKVFDILRGVCQHGCRPHDNGKFCEPSCLMRSTTCCQPNVRVRHRSGVRSSFPGILQLRYVLDPFLNLASHYQFRCFTNQRYAG